MTAPAKLASLGGEATTAVGGEHSHSPMILQRGQRSWPDLFPRAQDQPASGWVVFRSRTGTFVRAFDQGTVDLADKAMAHRFRANVRLTADTEGPRGADRERAEAQWAVWLPHRGIGGPAAGYSYRLSEPKKFRLNEPMELPALGRDFDARGATDLVAATEVREQKKRNRAAIRLMDAWLHEDASVDSDTWDLLKSELDRDRLSTRRLWP